MKALLSTYRYGSVRQPNEGLRLGVARHVPRGVRREDWQCRNYFDLWLSLLAPTPELVAKYKGGEINFGVFSHRYRGQMKATECRQVIELLASISLVQPISIGCFCEDESRCHRSLLRKLLLEAVKEKASGFLPQSDSPSGESVRFASPVCFASDQE